ncbi:hypothetical protein SAMN04487967_3540 [Natronorubrum sediminis]|uniref:Uncharacterized protein n=1 Tax=Natronorubrum sediminis TaxID=640943 RepID=A0A1H6G826_9EURY|nr:hypothetical protein [Natronorubrum sediminis]SEH18015.1 hypothetical protein SAMN04487967_3540 [Natronorubrum sediminis]
MDDCPRRALLGGIGAAVAATTAGCLSLTDDSAPSDGGSDDDVDVDVETLFEYVPDAFDTEITLTAADIDRLETADTPDGYGLAFGLGTAALQEWGGDAEAVSSGIVVEDADDFSVPLTVISLEDGDLDTLDLETDVSLESKDHDSGVSYEYATHGDSDDAVAVVDDVALFAESESTIDAALETVGDDEPTLLDEEPALSEGLDYISDADTRTAITDVDDEVPEFDLDGDDIDYVAFATTVVDADTLEHTYVYGLASESLVTDEIVSAFEDELAQEPAHLGDEPTIETDDNVVTLSWTTDLEAQRQAEDHDSPSGLQVESFDPDDEYVHVRFTSGDPTPVDELTIELEDEEYDDEIWADGQTEVGEDDTIRFEMDVLEPNLSVTVSHEGDGFGSSFGTTIFNNFIFDLQYDADAETMTIRYEDEYALDGDKLVVGVYDDELNFDSEDDPVTSETPWEGDTLEEGAEVTLDSIEPGQTVVVGWEEPTIENSLAQRTVQPPGVPLIEYEYEANRLTVELTFEDDESEPADDYELRIDDEPASTQWSDDGDTVSDGSTLTLDDVETGAQIGVFWDEDFRIGGSSAVPNVDILAEIDGDSLVLEYEDGPSLPVSSLEIDVFADGETTEIDLEEEVDETFEEGERVTLMENVETEQMTPSVSLRYDGNVIGSAFPDV